MTIKNKIDESQRKRYALESDKKARNWFISLSLLFVCVGFVVLKAKDQFSWSGTLGQPSLTFFLIAGWLATISVRQHVILVQILRGQKPIFDRPAPEWITLLFFGAIVAGAWFFVSL